MSLLVIMLPVASVGLYWSALILADEHRYLRAVTPLAGSQRFGGLAGRSVSMALRHRARSRRLRGPVTRRISRGLTDGVGTLTRRLMGTRGFVRSWPLTNRWIHRHRRIDPRIAPVMVALAAMGTLYGGSQRLGSAIPKLRR